MVFILSVDIAKITKEILERALTSFKLQEASAACA